MSDEWVRALAVIHVVGFWVLLFWVIQLRRHGGKADMPIALKCPLMTRSGHRPTFTDLDPNQVRSILAL